MVFVLFSLRPNIALKILPQTVAIFRWRGVHLLGASEGLKCHARDHEEKSRAQYRLTRSPFDGELRAYDYDPIRRYSIDRGFHGMTRIQRIA